MDRPAPIISVIVPVYNAERFLPECVSSVQHQSMQDWELILVDDGSSDGSLSFCEECARKDARIKVYHKENGGVSSARNYGLREARGEWITFIDADDTIPGDYFPESLSESIEMYLTNVKYFPENVYTKWVEPRTIDEADYPSFLGENAHWVVMMAPWGKFIRSRIIWENGLSFDSRFRLGEDTLFILRIEKYCRSVAVTNSFYCYRYDSDRLWARKYSYDTTKALLYFDVFLDYYKQLRVNAPKLVSAVFCNITKITDKSSMSRVQWVTQPQILEMKRLLADNMTLKERIKYRFSVFLAFFFRRTLKEYNDSFGQ